MASTCYIKNYIIMLCNMLYIMKYYIGLHVAEVRAHMHNWSI